MKLATIIISVLSIACSKQSSNLTIANNTQSDSVVYISFGSDSVILPSSNGMEFCKSASKLNCNFTLTKNSSQSVPLNGNYLNATVTFNSAPSCGSTKAELNLNNPKWYDIADISLVDGYSNNITIKTDTTTLGPPVGKDGNEKVFGLYPFGCDICVSRQNPPCGIDKGKNGCKSGSQYNPDVPCQWQGKQIGGGSNIIVSLVN